MGSLRVQVGTLERTLWTMFFSSVFFSVLFITFLYPFWPGFACYSAWFVYGVLHVSLPYFFLLLLLMAPTLQSCSLSPDLQVLRIRMFSLLLLFFLLQRCSQVPKLIGLVYAVLMP